MTTATKLRNQDVFPHSEQDDARARELLPRLPVLELLEHADYQLLAVSPSVPVALARSHWSLNQFHIQEPHLYRGYASTVHKAIDRQSMQVVALKIYELSNLNALSRFQVLREASIHSRLSHAHIVQLHVVFKEVDKLVFVFEFADGGDLFHMMRRYAGRRLHEGVTLKFVLHPLLLAVQYLHTLGVVHRDIKPENILFTRSMSLKLADFGLAIDLTDERAVTRLGTLDFMAPEVLRCPDKQLPNDNKERADVAYGPQVDSWAIGALAYELLTGRAPFSAPDANHSVLRILRDQPAIPPWLSVHARAFISSALSKFPGDRPTVAEMLAHPWMAAAGSRPGTSSRARPQVGPKQPAQPSLCTRSVPLSGSTARASGGSSEEAGTAPAAEPPQEEPDEPGGAPTAPAESAAATANAPVQPQPDVAALLPALTL